MSNKWKKLGSVRISRRREGEPEDAPERFYLKVEQNIPAGSNPQLRDPRKYYELLAERGDMSQEEADKKINSIPDYVKYDVILPPPKDEDNF